MSQATVQTGLLASIHGWRDHAPVGLVVLAALASGGLMWLTSQSLALAGGFIGMGLVVAAAVFALRSRGAVGAVSTIEGNDWSLVRAIADSDELGTAVTDRTGRLVCANDLYCDWFGGAVTPPNLPVDARTVGLLADAGRAAWRDGEAAVAAFACRDQSMTGSARRIGRVDDHLLWHFRAHVTADPIADAVAMVTGTPGRVLAESGVMAVLVSAAGMIRAANAPFRLRATGSADAPIEGYDFATALRVDEHGLFRFAREREGPGATPLRIIEVPLDRQSPSAPLLLFIIDEDGGAAERGIALDYVESLLTSLPFGMAMVDRDGRFLFVNNAFAKAAGVPAGTAPTYPGDLVVAEDKGALGEAIRRHAGGRTGISDITVRLRSRPETPAAIGLSGVRGMGEASVLLSIKDHADEGDLQQQMAQATKMQAVGQLAGGIAHDFNNILTAVLGCCDLMLMRHTPGDSDYDDIQQIRSNANRAANLTRQLLAFSRQQTLRPQILNLSDIVADVSHLLQRLIGDNVELVVQHGRGLGPVRADPVQLEQVIVNLAVNARDAMAGGGTLTIATKSAAPADVRALEGDVVPPGDYSVLTVADTGTGIDPDVLLKIFDPFFTTKDVGKGTGLGLATVYGIVKQSGGYIFADSSVGHGSTFSIYLPVHAGAAEPERAAPPPVARSLHWGSGTILLVEDEDMVRAVAERALVRAGYSVVTANNGEHGLERLADLTEVDLVITDVMMPQMDGPTMVKEVRRTRADVPVLFMSGYAEEQLRGSIALANVAFLPKPFSVAQLIDAVAAIRGQGDQG